MKHWWLRYLLIGVAAYAVVLLATLPAAVAYPYLQGALQPLALSGLEGSVWSGRAARLSYPPHTVGSVSWSLRPLALLTGELGADLVVDGPFGKARSVGGMRMGGHGFMQDLSGDVSAAAVAPLLQLQGLRPEGRIELDITRLDLDGRIPVHAEGEVIWRQARIALPQPLDLGTFSATFSTDTEGVRAGVRDREGPLVVDAVLSLKSDGSYRVGGRVSAKGDAPPAVHSLLRGAGVRQQGGALPLNITGRLSR